MSVTRSACRGSRTNGCDVIVFCGVHFMAEDGAILSPSKTVLLPDLAAGCSLASTIDATQLRQWKSSTPERSSFVREHLREVKARADYCCTSGNAVDVVNAVPADREILFLPDIFLGAHVRRITGRANMHVWMGECHVARRNRPAKTFGSNAVSNPRRPNSSSIRSADARQRCRGRFPPATSIGGRPYPLHRGDDAATRHSTANEFIIATEVGILHRLRRKLSGKTFSAANERRHAPT